MKVKLLKKLRREANKTIYADVDSRGYAKVFNRTYPHGKFYPSYVYPISKDYSPSNIKGIENELIFRRREYVIGVLEKLKIKRMDDKLKSLV